MSSSGAKNGCGNIPLSFFPGWEGSLKGIQKNPWGICPAAAAPHPGFPQGRKGPGNIPVANVPSSAVLPVSLWGSSFSWWHLTLPSITLLDQGTGTSHGILGFLEAVGALGGATHDHLPNQLASFSAVSAENWATTDKRKLSSVFFFFFQ